MQQGYERIEKGLNRLDGRGGSIKAEGESLVVKEGEEKSLNFLDVEPRCRALKVYLRLFLIEQTFEKAWQRFRGH